MSSSRIVLREAARKDISAAVGYYAQEAGEDVALAFIDELERAFEQLRRHPEAGSPRYAQEVGLPGLRHWVLRVSPYLVFYVVREGHVDLWRVLHGERDIPAWMRDELSYTGT